MLLDRCSAETVDSRSISDHSLCFWPDFKIRSGPNLARISQPGLPIPELFSGPFARNAKSGFLSTKFDAVPGNATNNVGSAGSTLFEEFPGNATKNVQKKVPEWGPEKSSGIGRPGWGSWAKPWPSPDFKVGPKPSFGPALIFESGQKHQKWSEMGPESTVRAENRST